MPDSPIPRHVLVTGGCGFLGHHIVKRLLAAYPAKQTHISVLDLHTDRNVLSARNLSYHNADITDASAITALFTKTLPSAASGAPVDAVIHTISPHFGLPNSVHHAVNVDGTNILLDAARDAGVTAFVYTSSASAIFDWQQNLVHADERWPVVAGKAQPEYYTSTKVWAESAVLAANRTSSSTAKSTRSSSSSSLFLTTSLRPSGIFGEGDAQLLPALLKAQAAGKTAFQIGDNTNLWDFTYVGNVAHAHLLALAALLTTAALAPTKPLDHERVDGEAFFITNNSPVYFWDFNRAVWTCAAKSSSEKGGVKAPAPLSKVRAVPWPVIFVVFFLWEWISVLIGRGTPELNRQKLKASVMTRYYSGDKARVRLGYVPEVSLQEGIERSVPGVLKAVLAGG